MLSQLCFSWQHAVADVIVCLFLICFTVVCAKRGFIDCFFGFVSTFAALIVAVSLAKAVMGWTNGLFGFRGFLNSSLTKWFSKFDGFDVDISSVGAQEALNAADLPAVIAKLILKNYGGTLESGTTLGMLLGGTVSKLLCLLLTGLCLFLAVKLVLALLRSILNAVASHIPLVDGLNALLGAIVGLLEGLCIVCAVVSLLTLFPSETITNYFSQTYLVGALFEHNPLVALLGLFL